jgi:trimethylamine corrinoid protein
MDELFKLAAKSIEDGDPEKAREVAKQALEKGIDPFEIIEKGYNIGLDRVGDLFDRGQLFLPELMQSADAMKACTEVLLGAMDAGNKQGSIKCVIGTVQGDVHDIGKGIVASLFTAHGIDVYDLGVDVSVDSFINKALEVDADVIGTSSLLTTTMKTNKELIETLKERGLRDKFKVIIGGGPVTERFAKRIGADAFAEDANEGVRKVFELVKSKKKELEKERELVTSN